MQIEYSTDIHFPARKVSLQQLASLWSAVMTCLPEVRHCSAKFNRRGRVTGKYVYDDADELAHADLDVRPGELELSYIHIFGPDIDVTIRATLGRQLLGYAALQIYSAQCVHLGLERA